MPVAEQVGLEDPGPGRQGPRPGAPSPGDEPEDRPAGQAEGEDRPEPRPGQGRPTTGRASRRSALRSRRTAGGRAAPRGRTARTRRSRRARRAWPACRPRRGRAAASPSCWTSSDRGEGGSTARRSPAGRASARNHCANPGLAAEGEPLVPDDRQPRLGGDHQGQRRQRDREGPDADRPASRGRGRSVGHVEVHRVGSGRSRVRALDCARSPPDRQSPRTFRSARSRRRRRRRRRRRPHLGRRGPGGRRRGRTVVGGRGGLRLSDRLLVNLLAHWADLSRTTGTGHRGDN